MGVRFHKSVSLGKGAKINFSKSGPSLSVGHRGASLNFSKRGTYSTFGIPGTGLSTRTKIGGSKRSHKSASSYRSSSARSTASRAVSPARQQAIDMLRPHAEPDGTIPLKVDLNDNGEVTYTLEDTGEQITDKTVIRELRKLPEIKNELLNLEVKQRQVWRELQEKSEEASREFIDIYKLAPRVVTARAFSQRLAKLKPGTYERKPFEIPKPTEDDVRSTLETEARENVKGIFGRKKKEREFVEASLEKRLADEQARWEEKRSDFEAEQDEIECSENERLNDEYEREKASLVAALSDEDEVMSSLVEDWLTDLTIPADVSAQIDCEGGHMYLDRDLPEIEDRPRTTAKRLKSGQVKVVNKTQKQLKQEYATCVLGMAFFMAANIFDLNANISEVTVSGYTQRRDRNGDMADEYIYSVRFPREQFRKTVVKDPIEDINGFENRMKLGTTFAFGKIKPY